MADPKKTAPAPGLVGQFTDWWNKKPQQPVAYVVNGKPMVNRPVDLQASKRRGPSPYTSATEIGANIWKNLHPIDWTRDLLKGTYEAGKTLVTEPGKVASSAKNAADNIRKIILAGEFNADQDYKKFYNKAWNIVEGQKGNRAKNAENWMRDAYQLRNKVESFYTYYDSNNKPHIDTAAIARTLSQRPMEILSLLTPAAEVTGAKLAASSSPFLSVPGRILETTGKVANIATNPAPAAISRVVRSAPVRAAVDASGRKLGIRSRIYDETGQLTSKARQAFDDAGIDPQLFDTPEGRQHLQNVINNKGLSPAAIREATLSSEGVRPTRSMTTGERPMAGNVTTEAEVRRQGAQQLAQNMQDNVEAAYQQAGSHRGVFTNTGDFTSGVRQSIEDELSGMGLTLADLQGNARFREAQKALLGTKGFPGVFQQFDNLSGANAPAALAAQDLSGITHTYDYGRGHWVDPSGNPVTAPAKVQYLDVVSNRQHLPPPSAGQNQLTPHAIDSVRRNVNSYFPNATGDDAAALAAINRGIDNYVERNAANFTGDGAAMARDWSNARKTSQLAMQYGAAPEPHPFAPTATPKPYDPNAVSRTEAARNIVTAEPGLENSAVPTIWESIKKYVPSVGAGSTLGYMAGEATGLPGAGWAGGMLGGAATGGIRNRLDAAAARRAMESEFSGAPRTQLWTPPDVRIPLTVAGSIAQTAQADHPIAVEQPKPEAPKPTPAAVSLPQEVSYEEYQKSLGQTQVKNAPSLPEEVSPEEYQKSLEQPQPQYRGGRTAYKSGGKVQGRDIEPLVRSLMNKAKKAKKISNKITEPLLNEHDDAVASALAVAQKAI